MNAKALISAGILSIEDKSLDKYAARLVESIRTAEPYSVRWTYRKAQLGRAYLNCGMREKAAQVLQEVRERHPSVDAVDYLSLSLNPSSANMQEIGNRYIKTIDPDGSNYLRYLASIGVLAKISGNGLAHGKLFRLQPAPKSPSEALLLSNIYLNTDRRAEAVKVLKNFVRYEPENIDACILTARIALSVNARKPAAQAIKEFPITRSTTPPEVNQALIEAIENPRISNEKIQKLLNLLADGIDAYPFDASVYKRFFLECKGRWRWQYVLSFQLKQMQQANRLKRALKLTPTSS